MEKELLMKTGNKTCRFRMTKDSCKVSAFRKYLKTKNFFHNKRVYRKPSKGGTENLRHLNFIGL